MNAQHQPTGSAYFISAETARPESHTLSVLVDNEPGVLARVIGLFSGRGYNIESLTVSETEHEAHLSRITIVTTATPNVLEQIKSQLALRLADAFRAQVIDANTEHFIFEITGRVSKIEQFISIMKPLGLVEICRTGIAAMNRGPQGM
jgi:acetolactate synthase-1/3 small subunit